MRGSASGNSLGLLCLVLRTDRKYSFIAIFNIIGQRREHLWVDTLKGRYINVLLLLLYPSTRSSVRRSTYYHVAIQPANQPLTLSSINISGYLPILTIYLSCFLSVYISSRLVTPTKTICQLAINQNFRYASSKCGPDESHLAWFLYVASFCIFSTAVNGNESNLATVYLRRCSAESRMTDNDKNPLLIIITKAPSIHHRMNFNPIRQLSGQRNHLTLSKREILLRKLFTVETNWIDQNVLSTCYV